MSETDLARHGSFEAETVSDRLGQLGYSRICNTSDRCEAKLPGGTARVTGTKATPFARA